jgi:hypothetical protein
VNLADVHPHAALLIYPLVITQPPIISFVNSNKVLKMMDTILFRKLMGTTHVSPGVNPGEAGGEEAKGL